MAMGGRTHPLVTSSPTADTAGRRAESSRRVASACGMSRKGSGSRATKGSGKAACVGHHARAPLRADESQRDPECGKLLELLREMAAGQPLHRGRVRLQPRQGGAVVAREQGVGDVRECPERVVLGEVYEEMKRNEVHRLAGQ